MTYYGDWITPSEYAFVVDDQTFPSVVPQYVQIARPANVTAPSYPPYYNSPTYLNDQPPPKVIRPGSSERIPALYQQFINGDRRWDIAFGISTAPGMSELRVSALAPPIVQSVGGDSYEIEDNAPDELIYLRAIATVKPYEWYGWNYRFDTHFTIKSGSYLWWNGVVPHPTTLGWVSELPYPSVGTVASINDSATFNALPYMSSGGFSVYVGADSSGTNISYFKVEAIYTVTLPRFRVVFNGEPPISGNQTSLGRNFTRPRSVL